MPPPTHRRKHPRRTLSRHLLEPLSPRLLLSAVSFSPPRSLPVGSEPLKVLTADFNNDGLADIVSANNAVGAQGAGTVSVLLGAPAGVFLPAVSYPTADGPFDLAAADLNGDGNLDLVVGAASADSFSVLLGNGDGTFQQHIDFRTGVDPLALAIGDLNHDGRLDVAVAAHGFSTGSETSSDVEIFFGTADFSGLFSGPAIYDIPDNPIALAIADFNLDGLPDIATANTTPDGQSSQLSVLLQNIQGPFSDAISSPIGPRVSQLLVHDFNRDTHPDVVVSTEGGVYLLNGNADGTFASPTLINESAADGLTLADFTSDGTPDLVIGSLAGPTLLIGNSDGTFQSPIVFSSTSVAYVASADFNGDGRPDFVGNTVSSTNNIASSLQLFFNLGPATDSSPILGALDPTFGNGAGTVANTVPNANITSIDSLTLPGDQVLTAALDADANQLLITFFNADGSIDKPLGSLTGITRVDLPDNFTPHRVQADAGASVIFVLGQTTDVGQPVVARVSNGGVLDRSFGDNGLFAPAPFLVSDRIDSITTIPNGFLVGGTSSTAFFGQSFIAKITDTGALNTRFGRRGITPIATGSIASIATLKNGAIVATGTFLPRSEDAAFTTTAILTVKLTAAGKLDKSFGQQILFLDPNHYAAGQKILIQPDGKVVVSANFTADDDTLAQKLFGSALIRYTPRGTLDPTFNTTGIKIVTPPAPPPPPATSALTLDDEIDDPFNDFQNNSNAAASLISGGRIRQIASRTDGADSTVTQTQLIADGIDLQVNSVTFSTTRPAKPKSSVKIKVSLTNLGSLPIPKAPFSIALYLSQDDTLDTATDTLLLPAHNIKLPLTASALKTLNLTFKVPADELPDNYTLFLVANPNAATFPELSLTNNTANTPSTLTVT